MGILNVTPDSFSDGFLREGDARDAAAKVRDTALSFMDAGASFVDVG